MAYDTDLADRIRELIAGLDATTRMSEQKMFGGLAFLIGGNLAVAASGQGGILVRVDPSSSSALIAAGPAEPMEMRGSVLRGWLRVGPEHLRTKRQLGRWVRMGVSYAEGLGAKTASS